LAVAAIQTVEVRERFSDGIAWIQLGRNPLTEKEVRRLYEELFRQLVTKDDDGADDDEDLGTDDDGSKDGDKHRTLSRSASSLDKISKLVEDENAIRLAESRQRFQGGELDAIKEDLANIITKRKILICLDDVWRVDDAKWFIFDTRTGKPPVNRAVSDPFPYRILITTRTPSLLGPGVVQEVFVRIFSEHEAVKLLLSSAGRRPYGGKQSAVFNQARIIVKGCGNSPMAVRLAGGMLRRSNRNWNLSSPTWTSLIEQSKLNLEEASRLRSFANSVTRIVDLGFACVDEMELRVALRRCFITFAVAFRDNDWVHIGKGIPQAVVLKMFAAVIDSKQHTAEAIIAALEMMNLLERARHGTTAHSVVYKKKELSGQDSDDGFEDEEEETGPTKSTFLENPSFVMQDSLRAIGEDVAKREKPAFLPIGDSFTSFSPEIKEEQKYHDSRRGLIGGALRFLSKSLSNDDGDEGLQESEVHRMVAACLVGVNGQLRSSKVIEAFRSSKDTNKSVKGGDKLEEYMAVFLPYHLIKSQYFAAAGELLVDSQFIRRRVKCLGAAEATRKQGVDLLELRREFAKEPNKPSKPKSPTPQRKGQAASNGGGETTPALSLTDSHDDVDTSAEEQEPVDTSLVLRDGCRTIVDEVHRVVSNAKGSAESLSMAICLSTVGEALMKGKQPRDAMLRLEEAVIIYRSLLGENHVDVARSLHSVARALVKLGENRVALHKFTEAAEIYDRCNATMHFDSIANSQNLATLLVDLGEWDKAAQCFDDVIRKKRMVYGDGSVSVAKAINSYAILLAKHGRMHQALANYEAAKATYEAVPPSLLQDAEFDIKCKYDITLINLNIASIRSKKGDMQGAIKSYADGVRGLRQYEAAQEKLMSTTGAGEIGRNTSHVKHLVAALGRIGSLKLKVGDNSGALEAYMALLAEVAEDSPQASKIEAAKAHIKCATIYRQEEGSSAHSKSISHLREALEMYTLLFGLDHKDTLAIAASLRQWLAEESAK
jgi:tetratricopeptide (TPR) repeat protein